LRPTISSTIRLGQARTVDRRDLLAVAQHGDAGGEAENLGGAVADEQDALAAAGEDAQRAEQRLDLGLGQRGGRLVENEDTARVLVLILQRAGDGDHRALGGTKVQEHVGRAHIDVVAIEDLLRSTAQEALADGPRTTVGKPRPIAMFSATLSSGKIAGPRRSAG
jgi:hypothetical protein